MSCAAEGGDSSARIGSWTSYAATVRRGRSRSRQTASFVEYTPRIGVILSALRASQNVRFNFSSFMSPPTCAQKGGSDSVMGSLIGLQDAGRGAVDRDNPLRRRRLPNLSAAENHRPVVRAPAGRSHAGLRPKHAARKSMRARTFAERWRVGK